MCRTNYGRVFLVLGIVNIVLSIFSIAIQPGASTFILKYAPYHEDTISGRASAGVWCGAFFCATGVISVVLGRRLRDPCTSSRKHTGLLGALLGTSIASILFSITLITISTFLTRDLSMSNYFCKHPPSDYYTTYSYRAITTTRTPRNCYNIIAITGMGYVLILIAVMEFAISIVATVFTSRLLCCRSRISGPDGDRVTYWSHPGSALPQQNIYMTHAPGLPINYPTPAVTPSTENPPNLFFPTPDVPRLPQPIYGRVNPPLLNDPPFSSDRRYAKV